MNANAVRASSTTSVLNFEEIIPPFEPCERTRGHGPGYVWLSPHTGSSNASGSFPLVVLVSSRPAVPWPGRGLCSVHGAPYLPFHTRAAGGHFFFSRSPRPPYSETRQGHNIQYRVRSLHRSLPALVARSGSIHQQSGLIFNLFHNQRELLQQAVVDERSHEGVGGGQRGLGGIVTEGNVEITLVFSINQA